MTDDRSVLLYDARCRFCSAAADFVRCRDPAGRFRLLPLDSGEGAECLRLCDGGCDTLHLFDAAGHHQRSEAVLRTAARLGAPWSLLRFLRFVPRRLRDGAYDFVARRRA